MNATTQQLKSKTFFVFSKKSRIFVAVLTEILKAVNLIITSMRHFFIPMGCLLALSACKNNTQPAQTEEMKDFAYPQTKEQVVEDDYFGEKVADPYRWLKTTEAQRQKHG